MDGLPVAFQEQFARWLARLRDYLIELELEVRRSRERQTSDLANVTAANTASAIVEPNDAPATADDLRDDLVANVIPSIEAHLDALAARINERDTVMDAS
jgi:hypothetical protein